MIKIDRDNFFKVVRANGLFAKLSQAQVDNLNAILDALDAYSVHNRYAGGYVLATPFWEVGPALAPVREGFARTDAGAKAAVAKLFAKGKISRNYALPSGPFGLSYYGRGYNQLTHYENYVKAGKAVGLDLPRFPDLMLVPEVAAKEMVSGMLSGRYTGKRLMDYVPAGKSWYDARDIINGDKRKDVKLPNGKTVDLGNLIAANALKFALALEWVDENGQRVQKPENL